jgi:hypothetical protein
MREERGRASSRSSPELRRTAYRTMPFLCGVGFYTQMRLFFFTALDGIGHNRGVVLRQAPQLSNGECRLNGTAEGLAPRHFFGMHNLCINIA